MRIRSSTIACMLLALTSIAHAQETYRIEGKVKKAPKGAKITLNVTEGRSTVVTATVPLKRKKFRMEGTMPSAGVAKLTLIHGESDKRTPGSSPDEVYVYLGDGTLHLTAQDSLKYAVMKGSPINTEYQTFRNFTRPADEELALVNRHWETLDEKGKNAFWLSRDNRTRAARALKRDLLAQFAEQHPSSQFALWAIRDLSIQKVDVELVGPIFDKLDSSLKTTELGQRLHERIEKARHTIMGAIAPEFQQNDVDGKVIKLSDFRGKYLLLDFWASWCGPCRAEHPNLVAGYEKYKGKNFEILSISLDINKQAWLNAIAKDGLTWPQVSDLKGWQNEVAQLYGINVVPSSFLLDPDGKIIGINLRGELLEETLEKALN